MRSALRGAYVLFGLAAVIALAKVPASPAAPAAWRFFSFTGLSPSEHAHAEEILLVPLAALVVAVARLGFGVRVLSLFRPILLVLAFRMTGIAPGLLFLSAVLAIVVAMRTVWSKSPYYARVPFLLAAVAVPLLAVELGAAREHVRWMEPLAAFPIIALGLTCEGFVKVLRSRGVADALRQTAAAVAIAVMIVALVQATPVLFVLTRYPELLLADAGAVLLLAEVLELRRRPRRETPRFGASHVVAEPSP